MGLFLCPDCRHRIKVPNNCMTGQKADCPNCHRQVSVPQQSPWIWPLLWLLAPVVCCGIGYARGNVAAGFTWAVLAFLSIGLLIGFLGMLNSLWLTLFYSAPPSDEP